MKRLLFLALVFAIGSGAYRSTATHGPPAIPPVKPRHWRVEIPGWHPTRSDQRRTKQEQHELRDRDRRTVAAAVAEAGVPYAEGPRRVAVVITLRKGQHRPSGEAIWPAIEDALSQCGQAVGEITRGQVRIERSGGDEFGTGIELEETR